MEAKEGKQVAYALEMVAYWYNTRNREESESQLEMSRVLEMGDEDE